MALLAPTRPDTGVSGPDKPGRATEDGLGSTEDSGTTTELHFLDSARSEDEAPGISEALDTARNDHPDTVSTPPTFARVGEPEVLEASHDPGSDSDALVSYSEPVIAPLPERSERSVHSGVLRVPDIPDLDLHVASALEAVAQRIRAGELHLPPLAGAGDDASSLALALAALLAARH